MFALLLSALVLGTDGGTSPRQQLVAAEWCMPIPAPDFDGGVLRLRFESNGTWASTHVKPTRENGQHDGEPQGSDADLVVQKPVQTGSWSFVRGSVELKPATGPAYRLKWISKPNPNCTNPSRPECASTSGMGDILVGPGERDVYFKCNARR
jgi:hypothetical protein